MAYSSCISFMRKSFLFVLAFLALCFVPAAQSQVTQSGVLNSNLVGAQVNIVTLPSAAAAAQVFASIATGALSCTTYPQVTVYDTRIAANLDLADLNTITGTTGPWFASVNFVQLLQGDTLFAQITQAGVGCTGLLPLTISVTYMPAAGLCYSNPSACVQITGYMAGANGLETKNTIVNLALNQLAFLGGTPPGQANGGSCAATVYPYDVVFALPGLPAADTTYPIETFARVVSFPANFASSVGTDGTNPTSGAAFTLFDNGVQVGTVSIGTGGAFTFASTSGNPITFAIGDRLTVQTPVSQDDTLADVAFTLAGTRSQ